MNLSHHGCNRRRFWTPVAAIAIAGLGGMSSLGATPVQATTTKMPDRLYVVNCGGDFATIDLLSAKVRDRRSLKDELPDVTQPAGCIVTWPHLETDGLAFEMSQGGMPDESQYRDVRVDVSTARVTSLSDVHPPVEPVSPNGILGEVAESPTSVGRALAPFTQADEGGGRIALANEAARSGRFVLMRFFDSPPDRTVVAVVDLATKSVRLLRDAPAAYAEQLHLSQTGRSILVEVSAAPTVHGSRAPLKRSGRVVQIDVDQDRVTHDQVIPMLAAERSDLRVLCFSDDGQVVIGSRSEKRVWLVRSGRTRAVDLATDQTSACFFSEDR